MHSWKVMIYLFTSIPNTFKIKLVHVFKWFYLLNILSCEQLRMTLHHIIQTNKPFVIFFCVEFEPHGHCFFLMCSKLLSTKGLTIEKIVIKSLPCSRQICGHRRRLQIIFRSLKWLMYGWRLVIKVTIEKWSPSKRYALKQS